MSWDEAKPSCEQVAGNTALEDKRSTEQVSGWNSPAEAPNWVSWDEAKSSEVQVAGYPALEAKRSTEQVSG